MKPLSVIQRKIMCVADQWVCSALGQVPGVRLHATGWEAIAARVAAAEGRDGLGHPADAQLVANVLVERDAKAVGQQ